MGITINGKKLSLEDETTVASLLRERRLEPIRVAVEVNADLVPRRLFPETILRDGDRIEIVTFVGGG